MSLTTNRDDPGLGEILPNGQQASYLILSEEERAKGFVMPVYRSYKHVRCGCQTNMAQALCETFARNPKFYSGTFCCYCGSHFDLFEYVDAPLDAADRASGRVLHRISNFFWVEIDGGCVIPVGATPEEAEALWAERRRQEAERIKGLGI